MLILVFLLVYGFILVFIFLVLGRVLVLFIFGVGLIKMVIKYFLEGFFLIVILVWVVVI